MHNIRHVRPERFATQAARRCFGRIVCDEWPLGCCAGLARRIVRTVCCGASLLILGAGSLLSSGAEENRFGELLQNSPFGNEPTLLTAEPTLEFRGYVSEEGGACFPSPVRMPMAESAVSGSDWTNPMRAMWCAPLIRTPTPCKLSIAAKGSRSSLRAAGCRRCKP